MKAKQPEKPKEKIILQGLDVMEAHRHALDPEAARRDSMLLWAKLAAGKAKAKHLSDPELRSVSWFASLPLFPDADKADLVRSFCNPKNALSVGFIQVWLREPDTVMRLLKLIRERQSESGEWNRVEEITSDLKSSALSANNANIRRSLNPTGIVKKVATMLRASSGKKRAGR